MTGVAVYLIIGFVLFVPFGFLMGFIQHKKLERDEHESNRPGNPVMEDKPDERKI